MIHVNENKKTKTIHHIAIDTYLDGFAASFSCAAERLAFFIRGNMIKILVIILDL